MNTYFDNSSTSFPKPVEVSSAISDYLLNIGGTYGRAAYGRVLQSSSIVEECRDLIGCVIGTEDIEHIGFSMNATYALNLLIRGSLKEGGHVLISPMEHNSVARPLEVLRKEGKITYDILEADGSGLVSVDKIKEQVRVNTQLVVINHLSNVNGVIQSIGEIKQSIEDIKLLVDATQSVGSLAIDVDDRHIDMVAFTGHKGLLGPTGVGAFYVKDPKAVSPLIYGGTGSKSESLDMPEFMPDIFEAGTPNIVGICGLKAAIEHKPEPKHTYEDFLYLLRSIESLGMYDLYKSENISCQGEVFSLNHKEIDCGTLAYNLYEFGNIEVRTGLHCAPLAHKHIGTFPKGSLRVSLSPYHSRDDIEYLLSKLEEVE
ncbi:MAG: aminotransferase class V-fold PLP-dependent enzyme [Hyphomicrobiales bacterium]